MVVIAERDEQKRCTRGARSGHTLVMFRPTTGLRRVAEPESEHVRSNRERIELRGNV